MILGVDYGLKNIGLAVSEGELASPRQTLAVSSQKSAINKIREVAKNLGVDLIVVGISEGRSKNRSLGFGRKLGSVLRLPVEYIDETLSTIEAEKGMNPPSLKLRRARHAQAAAIILQRYLDERRQSV